MLLHSSVHQHNPSLSSTTFYSQSIPCKIPQLSLCQTVKSFKIPTLRCSISQIHDYGTVDFERRTMVKWTAIFKRISLMEKSELGSETVLNQWEKEGKKLTKWELCRVVKELRKYKRFEQALEVYDWMDNRGERFRLSISDAAIRLDLIAKVRGVSSAEDFFSKVPDNLKDRRIYGALLNAYVRAKIREKAEDLFGKMRDLDYAAHSLPFNVMMTLYMNLKEYDKVDLMVSEMMEKNISLDIYSYNIWLSARGSELSAEKMEEVFEQMKLDININPNWTTFSTMATMYLKMGEIGKAEDCMKKVETRITGRERLPYHYLLSLYGSAGKKDEVYRVWNIYKSVFPSIPNLGYHALISSLVRLDDIEGAEKMYDEWLSVKTTYDPRIANLLMGWYVKEGNLEKAESTLDHMIEIGGKPNSSTWEVLAEGHIAEKRISEALSCLKKAFSVDSSRNWKPKPGSMTAYFNLCDEEDDTPSKEIMVELLKQMGILENKAYVSLISLDGATVSTNEPSIEKSQTEDYGDEVDETELLLQGSL